MNLIVLLFGVLLGFVIAQMFGPGDKESFGDTQRIILEKAEYERKAALENYQIETGLLYRSVPESLDKINSFLFTNAHQNQNMYSFLMNFLTLYDLGSATGVWRCDVDQRDYIQVLKLFKANATGDLDRLYDTDAPNFKRQTNQFGQLYRNHDVPRNSLAFANQFAQAFCVLLVAILSDVYQLKPAKALSLIKEKAAQVWFAHNEKVHPDTRYLQLLAALKTENNQGIQNVVSLVAGLVPKDSASNFLTDTSDQKKFLLQIWKHFVIHNLQSTLLSRQFHPENQPYKLMPYLELMYILSGVNLNVDQYALNPSLLPFNLYWSAVRKQDFAARTLDDSFREWLR